MKTTTLMEWRGLERPAILPQTPTAAVYRRRALWRLLQTMLALTGLAVLFIHAGPLLRQADPTAAVVDPGALSLVLLAAMALATFLSVSHWLTGLLWPILRSYRKYYFSNNFKSLLPWQKITFYLVIYFGLLYAFVCCLAAVF